MGGASDLQSLIQAIDKQGQWQYDLGTDTELIRNRGDSQVAGIKKDGQLGVSGDQVEQTLIAHQHDLAGKELFADVKRQENNQISAAEMKQIEVEGKNNRILAEGQSRAEVINAKANKVKAEGQGEMYSARANYYNARADYYYGGGRGGGRGGGFVNQNTVT